MHPICKTMSAIIKFYTNRTIDPSLRFFTFDRIRREFFAWTHAHV
jgi:hypothetical protein